MKKNERHERDEGYCFSIIFAFLVSHRHVCDWVEDFIPSRESGTMIAFETNRVSAICYFGLSGGWMSGIAKWKCSFICGGDVCFGLSYSSWCCTTRRAFSYSLCVTFQGEACVCLCMVCSCQLVCLSACPRAQTLAISNVCLNAKICRINTTNITNSNS